tara:strand:- start:6202 stop:6588 length:387 start_codon:yes stop_codon:yes gene_type:complete
MTQLMILLVIFIQTINIVGGIYCKDSKYLEITTKKRICPCFETNPYSKPLYYGCSQGGYLWNNAVINMLECSKQYNSGSNLQHSSRLIQSIDKCQDAIDFIKTNFVNSHNTVKSYDYLLHKKYYKYFI